LTGVYGTAAAVDDILTQIRNDYMNPNYHGYNLMYGPAICG